MGTQSQQSNQSSQVYYDPEKQQYYTMITPQNSGTSNIVDFLKYGALNHGRNYLGNSLSNNQEKSKQNLTAMPYPTTESLFPALDIGLAQNLNNSLLGTTDNAQSSGAGRFLAPSNNSKGK